MIGTEACKDDSCLRDPNWREQMNHNDFQICAKKKVAERNSALWRPVPGEMLQGDTSMSELCEVDRDVSAN